MQIRMSVALKRDAAMTACVRTTLVDTTASAKTLVILKSMSIQIASVSCYNFLSVTSG